MGSQSKDVQVASSDQTSLGVWSVSISGAENTGDRVTRPSWLQSTYLRGFTIHWSAALLAQGWPGGRPVLATNVEKLPPEPRRHHGGGHGLGVFQYNCESLRAPDRLQSVLEQTSLAYNAHCSMGWRVDQTWVPFLLTQPQWTTSKRWMHDCGQHQVPSHSYQMCTPLDAWTDC